MKYTIENGKWKPNNGTFVRVPNEQIPEVIQMLLDNLSFNESIRDNPHSVQTQNLLLATSFF